MWLLAFVAAFGVMVSGFSGAATRAHLWLQPHPVTCAPPAVAFPADPNVTFAGVLDYHAFVVAPQVINLRYDEPVTSVPDFTPPVYVAGLKAGCYRTDGYVDLPTGRWWLVAYGVGLDLAPYLAWVSNTAPRAG